MTQAFASCGIAVCQLLLVYTTRNGASAYTGGGAAGVSAQSPITAQVLAAAGGNQALRRKSRLQHVTAAESQASPSGLPQQATPGGAAGSAEGLGQTPRGTGGALGVQGRTPRTGVGAVYMTPPTGSAQRPAVSSLCAAQGMLCGFGYSKQHNISFIMLKCGFAAFTKHWLLLFSVSLISEAVSAHRKIPSTCCQQLQSGYSVPASSTPLAAVFLQSCLRPNSPAVGGTPVTIPRLRQTTAKKLLRHAHSSAAEASGEAPLFA